jgi:hypothetical protein
MVTALRYSCKRLPEDERKSICGALVDIEKEGDLYNVLNMIERAMACTLLAIEPERKQILDRLSNIQLSISNIDFRSVSAEKDLDELKTSIHSVRDTIEAQKLDKLNMEDLREVLKERDYAVIQKLEDMRDDWLRSVEEMARSLSSCADTDKILNEVKGLKHSRRRDILGITGDISSIAGLFIGLIGLI